MSERSGWNHFKNQWATLTYYQRFEILIAHLLTGIIGLIALVSLFHLITDLLTTLLVEKLNPLQDKVFQEVFGEIMILLIALEFNHTLQLVARREESLIQTRIVLLIALLALARKFIILNLSEITAFYLLALSSATLSLGICYWLVRSDQKS